MFNCRLSLWLLQLIVSLGLGRSAWSQEDPAKKAFSPVPRQNAPSFLVRLDVNHASRAYREGDALEVNVVSEVDAYAYVFYHQADGQQFLIFPNSAQKNNRLKGRQAVSIPAQDDLFRWQVSAPFGIEKLTVLCTNEPLQALAAADFTAKRFTPVARADWTRTEQEIDRQPASAWGIDEVELFTAPRSQESVEPGPKRVGLFIGMGTYQFSDAALAAYDRGLNMPACERDGRVMAGLMREVGELSQIRLLTNEQATRRNIEDSITGWLRETTRPGDTAFIFFSGHGARIPDESGDETDQIDEAIIPYDYLSLGMLDVVERKLQAGTLDPSQLPRAREALAIKERAGTRERAAVALERDTTITDDLFGHWLQTLDGRQVVVILDSCFSGGLATAEKDFFSPAKPQGFDFLDRELGRLKDLGQRELALLSASGKREYSNTRDENDLGVFTYALVEAIKAAPAQLTLEDGFKYSKAAMARYFQQVNRDRPVLTPHEPQLFNYLSRPVLLRP